VSRVEEVPAAWGDEDMSLSQSSVGWQCEVKYDHDLCKEREMKNKRRRSVLEIEKKKIRKKIEIEKTLIEKTYK
jgi:hypothetical protein